MKWTTFLFLWHFSTAFCFSGHAQAPAYRSGDLLVRLRGDATFEGVMAYLQPVVPGLRPGKTVAESWRIYLLRFDPAQISVETILDRVRRAPGVDAVQLNYPVEDRSLEPNDSLWFRQNNFRLLGLPNAWEISTGGLTPRGDTIVVAVLEKGAVMTHPDLRANQWRNHAEIPGDQKDNDGNGYTDDYKGWNPRTGDDNPGEISSHGTSVNGIIGASGNNRIGVSGVNWNVKLMNLGNVQFEDEIIAAYEYVYKARKTYNETLGEKGAFVVATNASFGLDTEWAKDHPLWCDVYNSLGAVGVLSAGATSNANIDVDKKGDMPSTCTSEFLIVVTNTDVKGVKVAAGFGDRSVDIGAPGEGAFSTSYTSFTRSTYSAGGGTSTATPQVSGVIALLYSYSCAPLTADALTAPATCARRIRDLILNGGVPESSLAGITTTGRRLDLEAPTREVRELCNGSVGPLALLLRPNPTEGEIFTDYETPDFEACLFRVHNMMGELLYEQWVRPPQFGKKTFRFEAASLPKGVYVLSIQQNKKVESAKFVKK